MQKVSVAYCLVYSYYHTEAAFYTSGGTSLHKEAAAYGLNFWPNLIFLQFGEWKRFSRQATIGYCTLQTDAPTNVVVMIFCNLFRV